MCLMLSRHGAAVQGNVENDDPNLAALQAAAAQLPHKLQSTPAVVTSDDLQAPPAGRIDSAVH